MAISPYTVIVMHPEYAEQRDNGYCGTFQAHVDASSPDEAIDIATHAAARDTGREIDGETIITADWSFVACFKGHLDNLYTP